MAINVSDLLIAKLDSSGQAVWLKEYAGKYVCVNVVQTEHSLIAHDRRHPRYISAFHLCTGINAQGSAVDPTRQFLYMVMASDAGTVDFGGGNTFTKVGGGTNMYLIKMSTANGAVQWARQYASSTGAISTLIFTGAANFLDVDSTGMVYIAAYYSVSVCQAFNQDSVDGVYMGACNAHEVSRPASYPHANTSRALSTPASAPTGR
jgi:hypothetical protein